MLILVGVTINIALNGGLFTAAQDAANDTQMQADKEQLLSAVVSAYDTKTGLISKSKLETNLGTGWSVNGSDGGPYTVTSPEGNAFTINKDGTIIGGNDEPALLVYEYTLAELIEMAQESTSGGMVSSNDEGIVDGIIIPYSEFWKGKELQGNETAIGSLSGCYLYNVTVEGYRYVTPDDTTYSGSERHLAIIGAPPEAFRSDSDEYFMMIEVLGLTEEDDTTQIKIKISGKEVVTVAEPTTFTVEDLIDAGELKENTGTILPGTARIDTYYEMSVDTFNGIIGTDITKLNKYTVDIEDSGVKCIRVLDNANPPYKIISNDQSLIGKMIQLNYTNAQISEVLGYNIEEISEDKIIGYLFVHIVLEENNIKFAIIRDGNSQISGEICTSKNEIPESLLKSEIRLLNSVRVRKLINS